MSCNVITKAKAAKLIAAWYGPLSAAVIAKRFKLSTAQAVRDFWQKAKADGRLPADRARPFYEARTTLPASLDRAEIADAFPDMNDDQFNRYVSVLERSQHERNEQSSAGLLSALRSAHGDLDHPKFHHWKTAPASLGGLEAA